MARTPGSLNKNSLEIRRKLEKMGCDPISGLARIGMAAEKQNDVKTATKCYSELAQYVATKLKAIEITGDGGGPAFVAYMPAPSSSAAEWMAQHSPGAQQAQEEPEVDSNGNA